jgi:hypothetical protein
VLEPIQSLWVGKELSTLERMCIESYQRMGHEFHLYVYGLVTNVPADTLIGDANLIVSSEMIGKFQNLANFSDYFRYVLLYKNGGYWVDLDNFCLRPYDFPEPYVFSSQLTADRGMDEGNAGVIKVPAESRLMFNCLNKVLATDVQKTEWAGIGPILLRNEYAKLKLDRYMKSRWVFCPLNFFEAPANVIGPDTWMYKFPEETYSVHLWNEEMRRAGVDKNAKYPNSLYERLKATGR